MIVRDALRSLRYSRSQAVFYWVTLLLTTTFLYLYFIMMMSDSVTAGFLTEGTDFLATAVTVTVIVICMIAILYANSYFVRRKAPELAVRLISGATYTQLSMYLLLQTLTLMILAMPLGILIGRCSLPLLSRLVSQYAGVPYTITVGKDGIVMASVFLGFVVFWIIMLNLSFAYRNAANMMFNTSALAKGQKAGVLYLEGLPSWLRTAASAALFLIPAFLIAVNPHAAFLFILMSAVGLHMFTGAVIVPLLTKRTVRSDAVHTAAYGFLRSDVQVLRLSTILYFTDAVLLLSALTMKDGQPVEMAMYMLSYIVMNIMLSLALLFQFSSELSLRNRYFTTLANIGFTPKLRNGIQRQELTGLFGWLGILDILYTGVLLVTVYIRGRITLPAAGLLFVLSIVPLILCAVLCRIHYRRVTRC
ncbi:MAG: hypothetical protein IKG46_11690 [Solobacterium sp.]|nr:hypothetical protein [Solobacterium sp.]